MASKPRNRKNSGITLIDTLAATLIISVAMVGSVTLFFRSTTLTSMMETQSFAENIARYCIEQVRNQGFNWCSTTVAGSENAAPCDGTITTYFDANGAPLTSSTNAVFTATTTVSSSPTPVGGVVSTTALRTATVTVTNTSTGATLLTSATYLTWGGV